MVWLCLRVGYPERFLEEIRALRCLGQYVSPERRVLKAWEATYVIANPTVIPHLPLQDLNPVRRFVRARLATSEPMQFAGLRAKRL